MGKGGGGEDMSTNKPAGGAQFTPGPWNVRHYRVAPTNCQWSDVTDSTGGLITHVPSSKGNAALIAAAPAMYEALETVPLPKHNEAVGEFYTRFYAWYEGQRKQALAQAEGRQA